MRTKHIVWLTLCWLTGSACDSNFGNKTSGQACTRSSQCADGLRCREGLCHPRRSEPPPDAARDAGEPDVDATDEQPTEIPGM
jgi:hypothetical protein